MVGRPTPNSVSRSQLNSIIYHFKFTHRENFLCCSATSLSDISAYSIVVSILLCSIMRRSENTSPPLRIYCVPNVWRRMKNLSVRRGIKSG